MIGAVTSRFGLGITYSTTYYEPFHVARLFGTLDLMTKGRAAWNVVTSLNNSEAANFGRTEHLAHDLRYDRADEFMEVVLGLWDSWEDGALRVDKASGQFADPAKVHALHHQGKFFSSKGPLPVPRSPQGHPVLIQAGQSGRGRSFAGRWGELIFVVYPNLAAGQKQYGELKAAVTAGRAGSGQRQRLPGLLCLRRRQPVRRRGKARIHPRFRQAGRRRDAAVRSPELRFWQQGHGLRVHRRRVERKLSWSGFRERVVSLSGKPNPTVRDFVHFSGRGTIGEFPIFCGTPAAGGRPDGGMVHQGRPATASCWRRRTRRGRSRILPATSCRSCSGRGPVSQGLRRQHAARESGPAAPGMARRLADVAVARARFEKKTQKLLPHEKKSLGVRS